MKLLVTIVILISNMIACGQNIIIGDSVAGGASIPFIDTLLSSVYPGPAPDCKMYPPMYYIDLNQDNVDDILVHLDCYMGGNGSMSVIQFLSYGEFHMLVDTSFLTTFQDYDYENDTLITWIDNYTIPKPYYYGDTIIFEQVTSQNPKNISAINVGYDPYCYYIYLDDFAGDTLHIAFRRDNGNQTSFYYIKAYIISKYKIHLVSAWSTDVAVGVSEFLTEPTRVLHVDYFDLHGRHYISKPSKGFYIERKITNNGIISKKYFIQ